MTETEKGYKLDEYFAKVKTSSATACGPTTATSTATRP